MAHPTARLLGAERLHQRASPGQRCLGGQRGTALQLTLTGSHWLELLAQVWSPAWHQHPTQQLSGEGDQSTLETLSDKLWNEP